MPHRLVLALLALLAAALMGLAACGGDDDGGNDPEATELLDKAFGNSIGSADVTLDVELKIEGIEQLKDPIRLKLTGPYKSNGADKIPSFDWDINASFGGQSGAFKFLSTGDNAYVGFQGTNYEIGEEAIAQANRQAAEGEGSQQPFAGLKPREWIRDAEEEGDEDVNGVETTHVSGSFDIKAFLEDINEVAASAGEFGGAPAARLSDDQINQFAEAVDDPSFDVYVGKDDERLHRLSTDIEFDVPEEQRAGLGGASGGSLSVSIQFSNIGKPVEITAPSDARPLSDLTEQLEGLGGLGGLGSGGTPPQGTPPEGDPGGGGGAPGTPDTDALERYAECLEDADPGDTEAIQQCSELLR